MIDSHITRNIVWLCIFVALLLALLAGSIIKRKRVKGWNLATVILLALSVLCAISCQILLVYMYKRIEAIPEEAFEAMACTETPYLMLSWLSVGFLLSAFVMLYFALRRKNKSKTELDR